MLHRRQDSCIVCTHFRQLVHQHGSNASAQRQQMALVIHFDTNPTSFSVFILINNYNIKFIVEVFCTVFYFPIGFLYYLCSIQTFFNHRLYYFIQLNILSINS